MGWLQLVRLGVTLWIFAIFGQRFVEQCPSIIDCRRYHCRHDYRKQSDHRFYRHVYYPSPTAFVEQSLQHFIDVECYSSEDSIE